MKNTLLLATGLAIALLSTSCQRVRQVDNSARTTSSSRGMLQGSVLKVGDTHRLTFRLLNGSKEPLVISEQSLPWSGDAVNRGDDPTLRLEAIGSLGVRLKPARLAVDLGPAGGSVTILPGKALEGSLVLESYFPEIEEALRGGPVKVQWRYRLTTAKDTRHVSGHLAFSE